ncbi:10408_t:CDS:2, partial [Acaulospora colombiana]
QNAQKKQTYKQAAPKKAAPAPKAVPKKAAPVKAAAAPKKAAAGKKPRRRTSSMSTRTALYQGKTSTRPRWVVAIYLRAAFLRVADGGACPSEPSEEL